MKQNEIFLNSEGDAWFHRNEIAIFNKKMPDEDLIIFELLKITKNRKLNLKILEIGCGNGYRLDWIKKNLDIECYGIEPSQLAVNSAKEKGLSVTQGTAEMLPFETNSIDIIIFGFCLYLCDREDLFRIASEADRVCTSPGWIIIEDFYSANYSANKYHHFNGLKSYKMDYRNLFTWHPFYECISHKVVDHVDLQFSDEKDGWISVSTLRKYQI
jgi:ubiquinone/menaquinone biosynthesis C-methylase UbiE